MTEIPSKLSSLDPDEILIEPPRGWFSLEPGELWRYRELFYFLGRKDIKVLSR